MNTKISGKDFFLQFGAMIALYTGAIALINLLFTVINVAFPRIVESYGYYYQSSISLPVATLIVAFPLFLGLSLLLQRSYIKEPEFKQNNVRKGLLYLTLFSTGFILAGDLVTLIYLFLDGQDITTGFILKVLAVFVVAGGIFGYYLADLRNHLTPKNRIAWRFFAGALVVGSIITGFSVIGSPSTQRQLRQDGERVSALQEIQSRVINYWQLKAALPTDLSLLEMDTIYGRTIPLDPETKESYEYVPVDSLSFKLCATFNKETPVQVAGNTYPSVPLMEYSSDITVSSNWQHQAGYQCFIRTIDPDLYPTTKNKVNL